MPRPPIPFDYSQLTQRWFEQVWNARSTVAIDKMLAPGALIHGLGDDRIGPKGFLEFHKMFLGAFPDVTVVVDDVICESEKTAARFTVRGTHRGDHMGFAATNQPIVATGLCYIRWQGGQIIEAWNEFDSAGKIQALRPIG
jgi:predicted ester cyclase